MQIWSTHMPLDDAFRSQKKYFKGLAVRLGNFINIPTTLSMGINSFNDLNTEVITKEWETGPQDAVSTEVLADSTCCKLAMQVPALRV